MNTRIGVLLTVSLIISICLALGIIRVKGPISLKILKLIFVFVPILGPIFYTFMFKAPPVNPDRFRYINQTVGRYHRQDAFKLEMQLMKMQMGNQERRDTPQKKEQSPEKAE